MANFQIPLNGSNIVSKNRRQAFQDALDDQHRVECQDQEPMTVSGDGSVSADPEHLDQKAPAETQNRPAENLPSRVEKMTDGLGSALDHTYSHQARTMDIHQQYLAQQAENIQLITAVLNQQGKVLEHSNGTSQAQIIETFQRTLDNFHVIREQGLVVHQEFLAQQAEFSERFLSYLEHNEQSGIQPTSAPETEKSAKPAEWVVHVPPIVLDEHAAPHRNTSTEHTPDEPDREVNLTAPIPAKTISSQEVSQALITIVAEKTGYPPEMLELDMDLEADLGIDSIKRVEILGALEDQFPSLPPADTEVLSQTRTLQEIVEYMESETNGSVDSSQSEVAAPNPGQESSDILPIEDVLTSQAPAEVISTNHSIAELSAILLEIVAEKTGYPVEMLEADMDMEADLGIDSIKRVEILGVMEDRVPGLPAIDAETLAELRTLGQIADLMNRSQKPAKASLQVSEEEKKKVKGLELQNTPVILRNLPSPDRLEFLIPADNPVIVTNDGTDFTGQVVSDLIAGGWKVALWDFPANLVSSKDHSLPAELYRVNQIETGKKGIDTALEVLRKDQGSPVGFIHLHPQPTGKGIFSDRESELIKQVFLIAGSLKADFIQPAANSRKLFLAVTRTDGELGFSTKQSFQEGSGLTGLVKSLNWEWPEVFCRAVDLDQEIDLQKSSKLLLQEIHDPSQGLLEVGIRTSARVTLIRKNG